jgi:hypothetical protein
VQIRLLNSEKGFPVLSMICETLLPEKLQVFLQDIHKAVQDEPEEKSDRYKSEVPIETDGNEPESLPDIAQPMATRKDFQNSSRKKSIL